MMAAWSHEKATVDKEFFVFTLSRVTTKLTNLFWHYPSNAKIHSFRDLGTM